MKNYYISLLIINLCLYNLPIYSDSKPKLVDLIILHGNIITMNKSKEIINDGAIAIDKEKIIEIGSSKTIKNKYTSCNTIDAKNNAILPGLINAHTHAAMVLLRGFEDNSNLHDWLNKYIRPAEKKFMSAQAIYAATQLACIEMIRGGTTTFIDMYFHEDSACQAVDKMCIRAVMGQGYCKEKSTLNKLKKFIKKWQKHKLIIPAISTHSPYNCSKEELIKAKKLSDYFNIPLLIHMSETKKEIKNIFNKYSLRPFEYLDSIGFLGDRIIAAHSIYVTNTEIDLIKKYNISVVHCPSSNMKLASGIAPVEKMLQNKINVALGTDGAASNNALDMFFEMKTASLLQKLSTGNAKSLTPYQALEMATINGARAIHMDKIIGSLEPNKKADLIIIDIHKAHSTPIYNIISQLVYASKSSDVQTVIINGKIIMQDQKLLLPITEAKIIYKVNELKRKIVNTLNTLDDFRKK